MDSEFAVGVVSPKSGFRRGTDGNLTKLRRSFVRFFDLPEMNSAKLIRICDAKSHSYTSFRDKHTKTRHILPGTLISGGGTRI